MVDTIKISEMTDAGNFTLGLTIPALQNGANVKALAQLQFSETGDTASRPVSPSTPTIRYNTDFAQFEFWDGLIWQQISGNSDVSVLIARLAAHTPGDGASMIGLQDQGSVSNKTVQDLANSSLIVLNDTSSLFSGFALSSLTTGFISVETGTGNLVSRTLTGAASQIDITNGDGLLGDPQISFSANAEMPGTASLTIPLGTTAQRPLIPTNGMIRYNTSLNSFEYYSTNAIAWIQPLSSSTGVTSVSGTLNRITSTGGTTPVIDISASYIGQSSITTLGTITTGIWNATTIAVANGGTGVTSVTTSPTASAFSGWDANKNLSANSFLSETQLVTNTGGTTILTVASPQQFIFSGSTFQAVEMPSVATLSVGQSYRLINDSSNALFVVSSGSNAIATMQPLTQTVLTYNGVAGTSAASWDLQYTSNTIGVQSITGTANQVIASSSTGNITLSLPQNIASTSSPTFESLSLTLALTVANGGTGLASVTPYAVLCGGTSITSALQSIASVGTSGQVLTSNGAGALPSFKSITASSTSPSIQKFTSGSGTYTTPTSPAPLYIRVVMVGGGGGGAGVAGSPTNGGAGGNTTFGVTNLVANGGSGGAVGSNVGGAGGTTSTTVGSGIALPGGAGGASMQIGNGTGGMGGSSALGGAGYGGGASNAGGAGGTNTGSGGGGGGGSSGASSAGGGAGGYIDYIITSPAATYAYSVGVAGTAGAGTVAGGAGGSGLITVYEFYQ